MADSTKRRFWARWLAILMSLSVVGPVAGGDGTLRINATLFDKFAAASQPLSIKHSGWYTVQIPTFFGPWDFSIYCDATASMSGIHLDIGTQSGARVRSSIDGTICGIPYSSSVSVPVFISVDPGTGGLLVQAVGSLNFNATVTIPVVGFPITVPFNVNLGPSLTVLSIPLDMIRIQMESPSGPRTLSLVGRNHQLSLHNGYVEIQADVHFR